MNANDKGIGKLVHLHTDEGITKSVQFYCQIVSKDIKMFLIFVSKLLKKEKYPKKVKSLKKIRVLLLYLLLLH